MQEKNKDIFFAVLWVEQLLVMLLNSQKEKLEKSFFQIVTKKMGGGFFQYGHPSIYFQI